jgi:hypothetical protein
MGEALVGEEALPLFIIILVLAMVLWALSYTRIAPGIRIVLDTKNGIHVPWVHVGWLSFAWAFLFVGFWPLIDVLLVEEWEFTDLLLMTLGGLLLFAASAAIAPDASYEGADGDSRYLEVAPVFFGFFAAYQVWLVVMDVIIFDGAGAARIALSSIAVVAALILAFVRSMSAQKLLSPVAWILAAVSIVLQTRGVLNGTLARTDDVAPLQGWIVALFIGAVALAVIMAIAGTMVQLLNRHSGFRPYAIHTAWALWFFFWMILVWWRTPLLVTDGWDYYELLYFTIGPLAVFLTWTFLAPQATNGDAAAARTQYFEKAPQAFGGLALVSAWAIGATIWFVDGAEAVTSSVGWAIGLVLFIGLARSKDWRLHAGVVAFAWLLLASEYAYAIEEGVPVLS